MVVDGLDAVFAQQAGIVGGAAPAARVDDGRAFHAAENVQEFGLLVVGAAHHVAQVRAGEAHAEHAAALRVETELRADVFHHARRGRGCERQYGHTGQYGADGRYLEVGGTEVVAPLRDAVRLVHGDEVHLHALHLGDEELRGEAFGRYVEKLVGAVETVVEMFELFVVALGGVQAGGADAAPAEVVDLVLHERHQRRYDEGQALHGERRHLESDAFAAAGGHEAERVVAGGDALDDVELYAAEIVVTPVPAEYVAEVRHGVSLFLIRKGVCPLSAAAPLRACGCFPPRHSRCRRPVSS